ncbi:uncharacterized protein LOC144172696 isoform X2 [Haemaphysalis longicornis]
MAEVAAPCLFGIIFSALWITGARAAAHSELPSAAEKPGGQGWKGESGLTSRSAVAGPGGRQERDAASASVLPSPSPSREWDANRVERAVASGRLLFPHLTPALAPGLFPCGAGVGYQVGVFGKLRPVIVRHLCVPPPPTEPPPPPPPPPTTMPPPPPPTTMPPPPVVILVLRGSSCCWGSSLYKSYVHFGK